MSKTISKKQILMLKKDIEDAIERYENSNNEIEKNFLDAFIKLAKISLKDAEEKYFKKFT